MKISTFTESQSYTHPFNNPTWYIDTCGKKLLFITSSSDSFRKKISPKESILGDIDIIIIAAGCIDPIRELQYFLFTCPNADFYLTKDSAQKSFMDISHKVNAAYLIHPKAKALLSRIHFIDDFYKINQNFILFSSDDYPPDTRRHRQSLLIQKSSHAVLFANTDMTASATKTVRTYAQSLTRLRIKYVYDRTGCEIAQSDLKR